MSDMSRPRPLPPPADHERHDRLLVAQLVAGDPLSPEQAARARALVSGCDACAALVADLPAISRAVAQEPVPPRRRDFRLSPQQAAELRGNVLTRFLRGLSLPSSRAFQPAAAGLLSIGLLLVVVGYAWPEDGTITVQPDRNLVDQRPVPSALVAADAAAEPAVPRASAPDADGALQLEDEAAELEGAARAMEDSAFAESLAESQAGASSGLAQKATADDDAPLSGNERGREQGEALDRPEEQPAEPDDMAAAYSTGVAAPSAVITELPSEHGDLAAGLEERAGPAEDAATLTSAAVAPEESGPQVLLVLLGLALALGAGGVLLLGWLARRARGPLAP